MNVLKQKNVFFKIQPLLKSTSMQSIRNVQKSCISLKIFCFMHKYTNLQCFYTIWNNIVENRGRGQNNAFNKGFHLPKRQMRFERRQMRFEMFLKKQMRLSVLADQIADEIFQKFSHIYLYISTKFRISSKEKTNENSLINN